MIGLTPRARELLDFLTRHIAEHGHCPTYRAMAAAFDCASPAGAYTLVSQLEERGYVRRLPGRACAIEILRPQPAKPKFYLVAGPDHWDRRAADNRALWSTPVSCGTPGAACTPMRPPLSSSAIEPAGASDLPVGASAALGGVK